MIINGDDDDGSEPELPQNSRYLLLTRSIFSEMIINVNNEHSYLHYLNQLSVVENLYVKNDTLLKDFKLLKIDELSVPKQCKIKNTARIEC